MNILLKKRFNLIWAFCLVMISLNAQPYKEASFEQRLEAANEALENYDYYNAIELYGELYSDTRDENFLPVMAELNYELRDFKRAKRYFDRIFRNAKLEDAPDDLLFVYARTMRELGDYNKAYEIYQQFQKITENDSLSTLVENDIQGMISASEYQKRYDLYVTVMDKTINTPFSEYSPQMGVDGKLYYTSFNRRSKITFDGEEEDDWHAKIVSSGKKNEEEWSQAEPISEKVNKRMIHNSGNAFSRDGKTLYYTRQLLQGQEVVRSDIYVSFFDGTEWQGARKLRGINGDWLAMHPVPGELYGESVLFFASDMQGGEGGIDIYYAPKKSDTEYGLPVNLGEVINTNGNEKTPFYIDGKLYFSSDGHAGMGGLDIFRSEWDGSSWSEPYNMELGYNSVNDDYYFKTDEEEKSGYLVSNRQNEKIRSLRSETCCDDIYAIGVREIELDLTAATFESGGDPLTGVTVELVETVDGKRTIESESLTSPKGNAFIFQLQADKEYRIIATKDEYTTDSTDLSTDGVVQSYSYKKQLYLERTEPETQTITINEPIRLNNIYFDYDDDKILPESEPTLNGLYDLMNEYKDLVIELSAHTDARGIDEYNQNLSQRRAQSARQYLVNRGVSPDRIKAVGYGESRLLNECKNGVECTEEKHRLNRRVEFKILEGPRTIEVKKEVLEGEKKKIQRRKLNINKDQGSIEVPEQDMNSGKGQFANNEGNTPVMTFQNPFHDFGVIQRGQKVAHDFRFVNSGNNDLIIEMATACECTELDWTRSPVPPGEVGVVSVIFDSTERTGEQEVTVEVLANTENLINTARFRAFIKE